MLALRSMAAELRACRCRATHTVAHRSTTASTTGNSRRRKVLASDVFTACYTAIMATAAVVDAGRKDRRRRALDGEIAQAKSSLAVLLAESQTRDLAELVTYSKSAVVYDGSLEKLDILDSMCKLERRFLQDVEMNRLTRAAALRRLRRSINKNWRELGIPAASTLARCEEMVASEERNPNVPHREARTETQLDRATGMINDLVDELMVAAYWQSDYEAPGSHPSLDSPDSAMSMIRLLRSSGYPAYTHPEVDLPETVEARARLNETNLKILDSWAPPIRERLTAKICYNLLVCGVPPAIQNYNALILRFTQLGEHGLAQVVVDSFLHRSHLKATGATVLCLLHHYRMKRDILGFWGLLRRILGHDSRGLGLRRRKAEDVAQTINTSYIQNWIAEAGITVANGYYVECVELDQDFVEAIIDGLVDFGMLHEAAKLFAVCLRESWTVSEDIVTRLLHACISSLDSTAAKVMVQGLLNSISQASTMLLGPESISYSVVKLLRPLIAVSQAASLPEVDKPQLGISTCTASETNLDRLATAIWIRETRKECAIMVFRLKRVKQVLSETRSVSARVDVALNLLYAGIKRPAWKLQGINRTRQMAHIRWLEGQCSSSAKKIEKAQYIILNPLEQTPQAMKAWSIFGLGEPIEEHTEEYEADLPPEQRPELSRPDVSFGQHTELYTTDVSMEQRTEPVEPVEPRGTPAVAMVTTQANEGQGQRSPDVLVEQRTAPVVDRRKGKKKSWGTFTPYLLPIEEPAEPADPFGTPGTIQYEVAVCYAKSQDIDTKLRDMLLNALPSDLVTRLLSPNNLAANSTVKGTMGFFHRYLLGLQQLQSEETAERAEAAVKAAARAAAKAAAKAAAGVGDPFSDLLSRLPKPSISFWQRPPRTPGEEQAKERW